MGYINAVYIQNDFASVLSIKKRRKSYHVLSDELVDINELSKYLKKKNNIFLSLEEEELIDEKVTLSSLIKNDNVIRSSILHKLRDSLNNQPILFNYSKISYDKHDETITYQVDGVYEKKYLQTLTHVGEIDKIREATTSRFTLFGISKECIKTESFISVYTQANKVIVLAIHDNKLIFSRTSTVLVDTLSERQMAIVDEINRTVAYIHQQFREIKFTLIALSGSMSIDDIVPEHLYMLTQLPITVLYPNSFISGLENEKLQHYILALGTLFIPKELIFLPLNILQARQYSLLVQIILILSFITLIVSSFFTFESYTNYDNALNNYETIKNRLIRTVRNTDTYSQEELQKSWNHLQIAEKYLQYNPIDFILALKKLILIQEPSSLHWSLKDTTTNANISFEKSFQSLDALHQFEMQFNNIFNEINSTLSLKLSNKSDYKKLFFHNVIEIKKSTKVHKTPSRRRRR
jgi:hypothetical protein